MLGSTDINVQALNIQPYVFIDASGTTIYTGTSISFGDANATVWRIKKEWKVGSVTYMGYPDGDQGFNFVWNLRTGYSYS
jgi:hypothetical protein